MAIVMSSSPPPHGSPWSHFRPGQVVAAEISRRFHSSVCPHPSTPSHELFLVLSFGRCAYRLNELSMACILQAVLGGNASDFHVRSLRDRVFRFSVATPVIGFHIYNLRSFECSKFKSFFDLWHGGWPQLHF